MKNLLLIVPTVLILTVSIIRIYQTMYGIQIHQWQQFVYWISWGSLWTTIYHIVFIEWKEEKPVWKTSEQPNPPEPSSLIDQLIVYRNGNNVPPPFEGEGIVKTIRIDDRTKPLLVEAIDEMRQGIREIKNESTNIHLDDDIIDRPFKNNL